MRKLLIAPIFLLIFATNVFADGESDVREGLKAYTEKQYSRAAELLFRATRERLPQASFEQAQLFTGLALYRLGLRQAAAFPLVKLSMSGTPANKKKALDVLVTIADQLNERTLLDYSLERVKPEELSPEALKFVYTRLGEASMRSGNYSQAISYFRQEPDLDDNLYNIATSYLHLQDPQNAISYFQKLYDKYENAEVTNRKKGMALLGLARAHYQAKNWARASDYYRMITKDHPFYRESLKELSWSLFRAGRFRSALSPLETLHTPYYSNFYDPETLYLHGIIFLFSCRYQDIEPLLQTFDENYRSAIAKTVSWLQIERKATDYFNELDKAYITLNRLKRTGELVSNQQLPFFIVRTILDDKSIINEIRYLDTMKNEGLLARKIFAAGNHRRILDYVNSILVARSRSSRLRMANYVRDALKGTIEKFQEYDTQMEFLGLEATGGMKSQVKSKLAGESLSIEAERDREYYIQNGYRFWPFQGEYWRDEIGSYQYAGQNLCENKR